MTTNSGTYRESPPESFEARDKSWDELSYSAQYYHYNKDDDKQVQYNRDVRHRNYDFINKVKDERSCFVCDEDYNACLVFHHLLDKEYAIPNMASNGHSLNSIVEEINKCVILCANCHRKHHDGALNGVTFERLSVDKP